jgi:hypothetical protein
VDIFLQDVADEQMAFIVKSWICGYHSPFSGQARNPEFITNALGYISSPRTGIALDDVGP